MDEFSKRMSADCVICWISFMVREGHCFGVLLGLSRVAFLNPKKSKIITLREHNVLFNLISLDH